LFVLLLTNSRVPGCPHLLQPEVFCWLSVDIRLVDWYRGYGATTPCAPRP
jgi:hypothetical protein